MSIESLLINLGVMSPSQKIVIGEKKNMAYTTHGYHIPGTPKVDVIETANYKGIMACGGIDGCNQCFEEYNAYVKADAKASEPPNIPEGWVFTPFEKPAVDYSHMVTVSAIAKGEKQFNTIYNRFSGIAGELAKESTYTSVSSSLLTDEGYEEESAREKIIQAMLDAGYRQFQVDEAMDVLEKRPAKCTMTHWSDPSFGEMDAVVNCIKKFGLTEVYAKKLISIITQETGVRFKQQMPEYTGIYADGPHRIEPAEQILELSECEIPHIKTSEDATTYFENILASYDVDRGVITKILKDLNGVGITISETSDFVK